MKSQMYLLAAAIIVATITISLLAFKPVSVNVGEETIKMQIENSIIENVYREIGIAIESAYPSVSEMNANAIDFSRYVKSDLQSRAYDFEAFYLGVFSNSSGVVNVTVLNLLGNKANVTLKLNESSQSKILNENESWDTSFGGLNAGNYLLNVSYGNYSVQFELKLNDTFTVYADLRLVTENALHRKIFERSFEITQV